VPVQGLRVHWQQVAAHHKYGRDLTDLRRSWLVNKIRTELAMEGIKLHARVLIKNLQNMHEKSLPPSATHRSTKEDGA
jgi:hypothetical protein